MVNLTAAIGGMAIALTVDRFGHRRLVVLGTALCFVASLLGAFAGSIDLLLVWRFLEGLGFIVVTVSVPTLVLRVTEPARPASRHDDLDLLHAGRRGRDDADRGRHPARHVVAGGLAGGRRPPRWSCWWRCCCAPCRGTSSMPSRPIAGRSCTRWRRSRPAAGRSPSRSASAPIPAAGSPSWASCRPCRSSAWASRPPTAAIVTALVTAVNVGGQPLGRRRCCSVACRAPR